MRARAALAVLGLLLAIPSPASAQDKPPVMQVAGPEPGEKPAQVAGAEVAEGADVADDDDVVDDDEATRPKLLLATSVVVVGFSHSRPLGVDDGATVFEGRLDTDYVVREGVGSARARLELAIGGGSRLTGAFGIGLLGGFAAPLSPGKYFFVRGGAEGFYRQRPWGYASVIEAPKAELGVGLAPVSLEGSNFFKKLAVELSVSGGLAAGAWAGDEDPSLELYKRTVSFAFGGMAHIVIPGVSLRAEYQRVQRDVPLSVLRVRPCFGAVFLASCLDVELGQGSFVKAPGGELIDRAIFSIGFSLGIGIAWFEPQVPKELPVPRSRY